MPKTIETTIESLVDEIVRSCEWEQLITRLEGELPEHQRECVLSDSASVELYERVQLALPEPLKEALFLHTESEDLKSVIERDAAFLIGVAVGRRFGGAR
jgi:hypothetical protein